MRRARITSSALQAVLAGLFVTVLVLQLLTVFVAYGKGAIYADDVPSLIGAVLGAYGAPMGIILGAYFGARHDVAREVDRRTVAVAVALASIWNLLLLVRSLMFALSAEDDLSEYSAYLAEVSSASMFLVAGALTYVFVKRSEPSP